MQKEGIRKIYLHSVQLVCPLRAVGRRKAPHRLLIKLEEISTTANFPFTVVKQREAETDYHSKSNIFVGSSQQLDVEKELFL